MKNRVLGAAIALALFAGAVAEKTVGLTRNFNLFPRMNRYDWGGDGARGTRKGRTVAQDKRDAVKRRNVLRARGHHRDAVR